MFHPGQLPKPPKPAPKRVRKRRGFSSLFIFAATTAMVATGGFGVFPDNPLTQTFQDVIGESVPAEILAPFNSYMDVMAVPTIQPQPDSASANESVPDPMSILAGLFAVDSPAVSPQATEGLVNAETVVAMFEETQTQIAVTQSAFPTQTGTLTPAATLTLLPTATQSVTPTWTVPPVIIFPTNTKVPSLPTATPTFTATATTSPTCSQNLGGSVNITFTNLSSTETITRYWVDFSCNLVSPTVMAPGATNGGTTTIGHSYRFVNTTTGQLVGDYVVQGNNYTVDVSTGTAYPPAGFTLSNISLNTLTNGGAIFVFPNNSFTVNFNYSVWSSATCPGCLIQLVAGMGSGGVGTTSCAYDGVPGASPGASGSTSLTLTAPATPGIYDIVVQHHAQTSCANAITAYTGATGIYQTIGQIVVNNFVIDVFNGGSYTGNLGGRSGADAYCVANKPVTIGNPNVRALIAIGQGDAISDMPALYAVNTNVPLVYNGGQLVAKDWADLLDGSINAALTASGVPVGSWWSGAESDAGNALAATANCNGFTSSAAGVYGNPGNTSLSGSGWMSSASSQSCSNSFILLCIADP